MAMTVKLRIWRQAGPDKEGSLMDYTVNDASPEMSFLELLDVLNNQLAHEGKDTIAFDYDCREGICGSCSLFINGLPHGPGTGRATCQLYVRDFPDSDVLTVEPFRAGAFPILKDLIVDRSSLDRIQAAGGYVTMNAGAAPDGNEIPIGKDVADKAFDAAACIGCGACVAACKNASASLFVGAKVSQFALLPQGHPERARRVRRMVDAMEAEGFGACSNEGECEAVCPKEISTDVIARMNREWLRSLVKGA